MLPRRLPFVWHPNAVRTLRLCSVPERFATNQNSPLAVSQVGMFVTPPARFSDFYTRTPGFIITDRSFLPSPLGRAPTIVPVAKKSLTSVAPVAASNDLTVKKIVLATAAAFGSGGVLGAMGVGGAIIYITALTNGLAFTQLQAIALCTGAQISCGMTGAYVWLCEGLCNVPVAACLGGGGFCGAMMGVRFACGLPDAVLKLIFAGTLCFVICPLSAYSAFSHEDSADSKDGAQCTPVVETAAEDHQLPYSSSAERAVSQGIADMQDLLMHPVLAGRHFAVGLAAGFLFGAVGIGDTPLMIAYLAASGCRHKTAIGTGLLASVPICILAAGGHFLKGNAPITLIPVLLLAMGLGSAAGATYSASELSDTTLRLGFSVFVLTLGILTGRSALAKFIH